ncbi:Dabb family protein [Zooshikella marina]|uniref:Dabb family protein n=1 Tax=Zooshikella ganghwensis TaxID=202772 RepID=UPI0004075B8A|nr:Dabb family protein [Zooshikella ganghwensis]MBU2707098.1 Dabb family protein [Zooshikella ganghwensis]
MVCHIVLLKCKSAITEQETLQLESALVSLEGKIPGLRQVIFNKNISPEGKQQGFTHGFYMMFENLAARDVYLTHPEHQQVKPFIRQVLADEPEAILVIDL